VDGKTHVAGSFTLTYYAGSSASGTASTTPPTSAGTYTVVATFTSSDSNYSSGGTAQTTFAIYPDPTSIDVSASNASPVYGQGVTLTATVTTPSGEAIPTATDGTVTFYVDGKVLGTPQPLSGSPATATLTNVTLAAGQHTITAFYSGDNNFLSSHGVGPTQVVPATGLYIPFGVAVDGSGDVFIADSYHSQVLKVAPNGGPTTIAASLTGAPYSLAVDGQGDLIISDWTNGNVVEVTPPSPTQPSGGQNTVVSGLNGPQGVAVDSTGDVFVADSGNNRVVEVNGGQTIRVISGLSNPAGVAVDGQGDVYIADVGDNRVLEVTPSGSETTVGSGLYYARGVAVDGQGDVFIADTGNSRVVEVRADGTQTTIASGITNVAHLAVDGHGDVFISEPLARQVVKVLAGLPLIVSPATPTVSVSDAGGTYNGNVFAASDSVAGVAAGVDTTPANTLEGVGLTLDYVRLNSNGTTTDLGSSAPTLPGNYTVTASFAGSADYTSTSATTTFTIKTPITSITGPTIGVPGQPLTDKFAVTYGPKGPTQGITFSIDYGDGTSLTTGAGGPSVKLDHVYTAPGSFTIQVTATDKNGVVSQLATKSVTISTVALETDPSGGTALAVGGNAAGGDTITLSAADTTGKTVDVTINKTDYGTFTPTGHIFVYGQGGKDKITLKAYRGSSIVVPAFLYGEGSGGDKISAAGSAANNVLSGHGSNEILTGGQGRDLLIGGTGAATLNAGIGDDLLIGGWTNYDISSAGMTYDQKLTALEAVMAEWGSAASYATRRAVLAGSLNTGTVHDNYANGAAIGDQLLGNALANDWFFAGLNDSVTGKNSNDVVTTIS
jgi:sugar lactone lactonase YvrE